MKYDKTCTRAVLKITLCSSAEENVKLEGYIALDLSFLNLWAGTKCLRTSKVDNTSEKSHSPPWSRKCCRSREKYCEYVGEFACISDFRKNLQDHADSSGGKEPPQQVTVLKVSALVYFLFEKCVKNEKCTMEMK